MNASTHTHTTPTGSTLSDLPPVEVSTAQPNDNVRYVTPAQLKQIKSEEKHRQNVLRKREQRWHSPAANAKVEDLMLIAQDIKNLVDTIDALNREMYLVRTALFNTNIVTEADITKLRERQKEREVKFKELQADTVMNKDEKIAIAKEYELPLQLLGLQEETESPQPPGDGQ